MQRSTYKPTPATLRAGFGGGAHAAIWPAAWSLILGIIVAIHSVGVGSLDAKQAPAEDAAWPAGKTALDSEGFDHSDFDRLLWEYVTPEGLVDYDAFEQAPAFKRYLDELANAPLDRLSRDEQLALWINAYNAYTIRLINQHDERKSIRNINRSLGFIRGSGPWRERMARVAGETYTLDEIEHEIIRPEYQEPRIHFALVCAAIGCPPLRREAYAGDRLDEQLDEQALIFLVESPEKNRVDVDQRRVYLNPIFDWYAEDFGDNQVELGRYVARFFPPGPERDLLLSGDFRVEHTDYDWSLNIQNGATAGPR